MNLQDFFIANLEYFRKGEKTDMILLGAYPTEKAAREAIQNIIEENNHGTALIVQPDWCILLANVKDNRLFILPLSEYYIGYLGFFQYKVNSGNLALSIFSNQDAAEDAIDLIRSAIKDENGNIIF